MDNSEFMQPVIVQLFNCIHSSTFYIETSYNEYASHVPVERETEKKNTDKRTNKTDN